MDPAKVNRRRGAGIPTARGLDHVAITVPDLWAAVRFFVEVLGASLLYVEGPIRRGDWMTTNLAVPADASCRVAMLRFGPTANLELFEYEVAGQNRAVPLNSDVGGHHLAVYVDDIEAAHRYLSDVPGVTMLGEPKLITEGPLEGDRWMYFTAPWGLQLEIISLPAHLPYEQHTPERRYGPYPGPWSHGRARTPVHDGPELSVALPTNRIPLTGPGLRHTVLSLEAAGCTSFWVNDHLAGFPTGSETYPYSADGAVDWSDRAPQYEALTVCGFVSAVSDRARVGTAVLVLPQRHPLAVAKATASLHDLSGGRFRLGLGAGWSEREMTALGWDPRTRGARLDEGIDVIRYAWGQRAEPPAGPHYPVPPDAIFEPRPGPGHTPPVLIGGMSPKSLQRVRDHGDGWLAVSGDRDDELAAVSTRWVALRAEMNRPLYGVLKVAVDTPDPRRVAEIAERTRDSGWNEVCLEFDVWDTDDVCDALLSTETTAEPLEAA
ncbi:TIGR03619 family F420-dependent LLM class oxidoreductase [Actinoplanes sp. NPDC026670]|uniref:TIGR03619 family F420-dependent LLM class oxidoreductase n=1 Tax=Actinoplanes sp. NPDC026670 TaxID=3154700 RepID=UPI00340C1740